MENREVAQSSLIECPKCHALPTQLVENQWFNAQSQKWETEIIYRECPECEHIWDREPPLKPWQV